MIICFPIAPGQVKVGGVSKFGLSTTAVNDKVAVPWLIHAEYTTFGVTMSQSDEEDEEEHFL